MVDLPIDSDIYIQKLYAILGFHEGPVNYISS